MVDRWVDLCVVITRADAFTQIPPQRHTPIDIDDEITNVHRFVADGYAKKFPELESLVPAKMDYVRTVQRIGNEMVRVVVMDYGCAERGALLFDAVRPFGTLAKHTQKSLLMYIQTPNRT